MNFPDHRFGKLLLGIPAMMLSIGCQSNISDTDDEFVMADTDLYGPMFIREVPEHGGAVLVSPKEMRDEDGDPRTIVVLEFPQHTSVWLYSDDSGSPGWRMYYEPKSESAKRLWLDESGVRALMDDKSKRRLDVMGYFPSIQDSNGDGVLDVITINKARRQLTMQVENDR